VSASVAAIVDIVAYRRGRYARDTVPEPVEDRERDLDLIRRARHETHPGDNVVLWFAICAGAGLVVFMMLFAWTLWGPGL
jgi:hypothetical protein